MALIGASNSLGGLAGSNAVARLVVVISGQSSQLEAAVARSEGTLQGLSQNASSIGKTLTRSLTLPLLAIGGYAIKAASDFETSFARVVGISTILDKRFNDLGLTTQGLHDAIINMASDPLITVGPKELADALYYAGSAGLKASQALDVVKLSAEGASVGMGTASDISKVLIFALTNYADTGLTAASAMDTLTAAIKEGTAAPEELAISLGRLLPIAKAAGISFQTTVAAVASLSNLGVPTRVATTSLRALFSELLAPTQQATQRLQELGISSEQLRNVLSQGGLIAAMQLLQDATHGNFDALRDIIPQIRGFTAYLGLTDNGMERYRGTLDAVNHAQGEFQKVLAIVSQTPQFKFQVALKELNVAAITLGEQLLPIFTKITAIITQMARGFSQLPAPVMKVVAAMILLGAAAGPVLQLYGAITATKEATLAANAAGTTLVPTAKALTTGFLTMAVAGGLAAASFESLAHGSVSIGSVLTTLVGTTIALQLAFKGIQTAANAGMLGVNALSVGLASLSTGGLLAVAIGVAALITVIGIAIGQSKAWDKSVTQLGDSMGQAARDGQSLTDALTTVTNSRFRSNLQALASSMNLGDQPAAIALPQLQAGVGGQITSTLASLSKGIQDLHFAGNGATKTIVEMNAALQAGLTSGKSFAQAMADAGINTGKFGSAIDFLMTPGNLPGASPALRDQAQALKNLTAEYPALQTAINNYQDAQQASVYATVANDAATTAYAKQLGVSVDFLKGKLNDYGISAVGLTGDTKKVFEENAFAVGDATGKISAHIKEMQDNIDKAAQGISDAMTGAFSAFGDLPKVAAPGIDAITSKLQKMTSIALDESNNIIKLNKRGVPTSLIEQAISAGPGFVAHLASGTDAQLNKIVDSYSVALAAMDANILAEGAHQEKKGNDMVSGFAESMLSASVLPQQASYDIVKRVTAALESGNLKPAALHLVTQFTLGLAKVKGLTGKEAAGAVDAFVTQLLSGNVIGDHGKIMMQQLAQGIASSMGIPLSRAKQFVATFQSQLLAPDFNAIGVQIAESLANGITAGQPNAITAATRLAKNLKLAFNDGMKNSPKYFTYYLGQDLIGQMGDGMTKASRTLNAGTRPVFSNASGKRKMDVDLDVHLDRNRVGQELTYAASTRGW